jgi:hypothetical protein
MRIVAALVMAVRFGSGRRPRLAKAAAKSDRIEAATR